MIFKDLKIGQIFSFKQKAHYDPDARWIKTGESISLTELIHCCVDQNILYNAVLLTQQTIHFKEYHLVPTGLCVDEDKVEEVYQ